MRRLIAGVAVVAMLAGCSPAANRTPDPTTPVDPALAVPTLLQGLAQALDDQDTSALSQLADPAVPQAGAELADLLANVRSLGLSGISLRYLGSRPSADPTRLEVSVDLRWRRAGEPGLLAAQVPMVLTLGEGGAWFLTARVTGTHSLPLWLLGRVDVARSPGVVVDSLDPAATGRYLDYAVQARSDVGRYLPPPAGDLVIEVPRSAAEFTALLASTSPEAKALAAVTETSFGAEHGSILVNPGLMDRLSGLAAQIVVTHEAVHVALDAPGSGTPMWLQEGYADYVAFATHPASVRVVAADLLTQVARSGPPGHLPGPDAFAGSTQTEGVAYESAWLACRWIANHYGADRLLALYRAADRADSDARPLRRILGITRARLTQQWRASLSRLAG